MNDNKMNTIKLFCIDFDQTLVKGHYHNYIFKTKKPQNHPDNIIFINELLNHPHTGLKNGNETKLFIQSALNNGHKVAITSYSEYPEVIIPTFKKMGLNDDEINQIIKISFLPNDQRIGKQQHIELAMKTTGISDKTNVYLIDDSKHNCKIAKLLGFNVVLVPEAQDATPEYLNNVIEIAKNPSNI